MLPLLIDCLGDIFSVFLIKQDISAFAHSSTAMEGCHKLDRPEQLSNRVLTSPLRVLSPEHDLFRFFANRINQSDRDYHVFRQRRSVRVFTQNRSEGVPELFDIVGISVMAVFRQRFR